MGITCSLLGHDYGDATEERDREERGQEVVVTVREVRTCRRCGATAVESENTEVRSAAPEPGPEATDATGDATPGADPPSPGTAGEPTVPGSAGASDAPTATGGTAPAGGVDDAPGGHDPPTDPDADDGMILEDEPPETPAERRPGEWPSAADTRLDESAADAADHGPPAASPAADPADAQPDDEAQILDDAGGSQGASSAPGEPRDDPESADDGDEDGPGATDDGDGADAGGVAAEAATAPDDQAAEAENEAPGGPDAEADGEPGGSGDATPPDGAGASGPELVAGEATGIATAGPKRSADTGAGEFVCPSCSFSEPSRHSSLRSGDICPECQRGYLVEE